MTDQQEQRIANAEAVIQRHIADRSWPHARELAIEILEAADAPSVKQIDGIGIDKSMAMRR
jgi:hypothetical protein